MEKSEFYAKARRDVRGPLHGVVVVEITTTWAGPMAGCMLADFGATVIKVEHPQGEVARRMLPMVPESTLSLAHETVNRNKQNLSLDLHLAEGRDIFLRLCGYVDIVIENFKPGTLAGWGVGYGDVARVKPNIIYVSISGFGQFGPNSERAGYDPVAQNFSGWTSLNGEPDGGPMKAPTYLGDDLAGVHGALAALAALHHRQRTGEGQHIDVALVDGLLFQNNGQLSAAALGVPGERLGNQFATAAPSNVYVCTDGRIYGGVLLDSHWQALCGVLERPDLAAMRNVERIAQRHLVDSLLAGWCATRTRAEVVATFIRLGLAVTPVNTFAEAAADEHVKVRDMLVNTRLNDGREVPLVGPVAKFSRTPIGVNNAAPAIGQDNEAILASLGYSPSERARLRSDGVI